MKENGKIRKTDLLLSNSKAETQAICKWCKKKKKMQHGDIDLKDKTEQNKNKVFVFVVRILNF